MTTPRVPGVFCLEGPWSSRLTDKASVGPLLELLERQRAIRFAHRDASTFDEFETYLLQWSQKQYSTYRLGYLAFHGEPGCLWVGRKRYGLERLGDLLRGRLDGRILFFGSCETLKIEPEEAESFRRVTKARAICGYTEAVPWIESAAFELNLIEAVTSYGRADSGFKYLLRNHEGACERLGLRAAWRGGSVW